MACNAECYWSEWFCFFVNYCHILYLNRFISIRMPISCISDNLNVFTCWNLMIFLIKWQFYCIQQLVASLQLQRAMKSSTIEQLKPHCHTAFALLISIECKSRFHLWLKMRWIPTSYTTRIEYVNDLENCLLYIFGQKTLR